MLLALERNASIKKVFFKYTFELEHKCISFGKSTSSTYTSEFDSKYINFETLLQVYFRIRKQIHKLRKPTSSILLN